MSPSVVATVAWLALAAAAGLGAVVAVLVHRLDGLARALSDRKWEIATLRSELGALRRDGRSSGPDAAGGRTATGPGTDAATVTGTDGRAGTGAGTDGGAGAGAGTDGGAGTGTDGGTDGGSGGGAGAGTDAGAGTGRSTDTARGVRSWPAGATAWRRARPHGRTPRRRRPG